MAMATQITLFTVFVCTALLFVVLGLPLMRRTARLNLPGRFMSRSMENDWAEWREINAAAGRDLVIIGLTLASLALLMLWMRPPPEVFALAGCGWLALGATGILVHGYLMMSQHPHSRHRHY
jgi:hypothetical protein